MKKSERAREPVSVNDADRPETAAEQTGRDRRGRFTAGNAGGPGNPFARRVALLRTILMECVSDEEMRNIAGQLVVMAKLGDLAAIKLLFQYVLGKPAATVDPDTLDQKEVEWFCAEPFSTVLKELIGTRTPSDVVARFFRAAMPSIGDTQAEMIREACLNPEAFTTEDEDEDDFDDEEEEAAEQASDHRANPTAAPSTNGEWDADPRPRATRPSENGGAGTIKPGSRPADQGRNGKRAPRRGGWTFIDPRPSE